MPTYTILSPKRYTVMFNKECDTYDYMCRVLITLREENKPLSYYQIQYRIKTSRIKKALDILEHSDCVILLCGKYQMTSKGRTLIPLLMQLLDKWNETR